MTHFAKLLNELSLREIRGGSLGQKARRLQPYADSFSSWQVSIVQNMTSTRMPATYRSSVPWLVPGSKINWTCGEICNQELTA